MYERWCHRTFSNTTFRCVPAPPNCDIGLGSAVLVFKVSSTHVPFGCSVHALSTLPEFNLWFAGPFPPVLFFFALLESGLF